MEALSELSLDISIYGRLSYAQRRAEYPRTQDIGEAASFHGHDGLLVPSARSDAMNVVVFCDRVNSSQMTAIEDYGPIDWQSVSF